MSLILDAIKKSERERQQQEVPGLASNHDEYQNSESPSNKWLLYVGLLLLITVAIYFVAPKKWFTSEQQIEVTPVATNKIEDFAQQEIEDQPLELKANNEEKKNVILPTISTQASIKPTSINDNVINLNSEIKSSLPKINFSSHVFTGNSATSFVVLNDELLGIGELLNGKLEIIQINKDGMIISFEDKQIFIKALENINP